MEQAVQEGLDFNSLIHETLKDLLGEWASQEFFSSTATQSTTPEVFSEVAKRVFPGRTLIMIFDMIAKRAEALTNSWAYGGTSQFQTFMRELHGQVGTGTEEEETIPMHDHRSKDELDEFVGHRTT